MAGLWPTVLTIHRPDAPAVVLRALRSRDRTEWEALRRANRGWLLPWEATNPFAQDSMRYRQLVRYNDSEAQAGRLQPFVLEAGGRLVGQMHLFGIAWGSLRGGAAGYWVAREWAGRGIAPLALAALVDHAFYGLGLHRVEVNVRPENKASLRVVDKLEFRDEGLRSRFLHIDGQWCDHRTFALTVEDLAGQTLLSRWNAARLRPKEASDERPTGLEVCPDSPN